MTREEAAKIVLVIQNAYPQHYKGFLPEQTETLVNLWAAITENYTYEQISAGLKAFIANDTKGFPPVVGQVVDYIFTTSDKGMTALEAWQLVYRGIQNGYYGAEEEFEKLPELCKKAIGNPSYLRDMATQEASHITVAQSNFIRSYNNVVEREKELAKMPKSVRNLLQGTTAQMIGVKDEVS